ncbi:MAG: phosphate signaling complex protein PhoU [Eubacteriales bacterium]
MTGRIQMDQEMLTIVNELLEMGALVENAIRLAIKSLQAQDSELARKIIGDDENIDMIEDSIRDKCVKFMARQQPVAGDLRMAISILQMIRDLERIGDHCEDIAKYTLRFENKKFIKELVDIPRMADLAARMVNDSIDAFINKDLRLARKVWKSDEEVDEIYRDLNDELINMTGEDKEIAKQSVMFIFIAAHFERIADYATNICEETVFAIEGTYSME